MDAGRLVFVDEAGISVAESRRRAWAPKGVTPLIERPSRGRRINLIGAIALDGPRALKTIQGYVNGDQFVAFLREDLGPHLNPGDIVVMDSPSLHKVEGVKEALAERGATALYLPAYSPELNPIEMTWAWCKRLIRDCPPRKLKRLLARILEVWDSVGAELCQGWLRHCGYAVST